MIILGASGHAKDLLSILKKEHHQLLCFYDDSGKTSDFFNKRFTVLRSLNELETHMQKDKEIVIGTGNPIVRRLLYDKTKTLKPNYKNVISETAIVGGMDVSLGWGLNIMHQVMISNSVSIGNGTLVNRAAGLHHDVEIGNFCEIGPGANVLGGVSVGNNVLIGSGSVILPNINICDDATIGAGAVVTKNITKPGIYCGIPAILYKS